MDKFFLPHIHPVKREIEKYKKTAANALQSTDNKPTLQAIDPKGINLVNKCPNVVNRGYPGGWATLH